MAKKKICITLSRVFPATLPRAGELTEFETKLKAGKKIHTIRRNFDLWAVNAEKMQRGDFYLSVRQWSGKPYRSKQREIHTIDKPIGVQRIQISYHHDFHANKPYLTARIIGGNDIDVVELAKNDGLSLSDFADWFFGKEPQGDMTFNGVIIHFTDFRY